MIKFFAAVLTALALSAAPAPAQTGGMLNAPQANLAGNSFAGLPDSELRRVPWSEETLELAATIPLQDGGRVKPLWSWARFKLLKFNGKSAIEVELPGGTVEELDPSGWMLDALFFPEQAKHYRQFLVRDDALLTVLGLSFEGRKRSDRYSFAELIPARTELMSRASASFDKAAPDRTRLERDILVLASNVREFEDLMISMEFARAPLDLDATPFLAERFSDPRPGVTVLFDELDALRARWDEAAEGRLGAAEAQAELAAAERLMNLFGRAMQMADLGPGIVPPPLGDLEHPAWYDAGEVLQIAAEEGDRLDAIGILAALERAEANKGDEAAFRSELTAFHGQVVERAEARGEYSKIPMEVRFYAANYFVNALVLFLIGFLLVAATWLKPGKLLTAGAWLTTGGGLALLTAGIVMRCILRSRPPVSTLYETILFIAAVAVLVALFIEWVSRERIALAVGSTVGALGMFLSMRYELKEAATAGDTMPALQAVLDTNFWLATHVTTVTMGYAAGLLAAAISLAWLAGRVLGIARDSRANYASMSRMVYGVICFGLLFATVGTILGGIWANYSWGRFWGWDPKENGALMIVLWQLLILHSRLGGYIKQFGLHVLSVLGGLVVAFSWWGVNLLGVGLHSYGFTDGVAGVLNLSYLLGFAVVGVALVWYFVVGPEVANGMRRPERNNGPTG